MYPGVYTTNKKDGSTYYRAGITYKAKHISLGSSEDEMRAAAMYQEACLIVGDEGGAISLDTLTSHIDALPFAKAITLLNYRDNGLYIKNPIYLMKGYFLYYLDSDHILKFANDDLFYYSSHKIIRRGGHLFVNDYGMQYNILSRYGIKDYSVMGKDYSFANGDSTDYRYSNIIVINKYHGVRAITEAGRTLYEAKLHLRGNILIGRYSDQAKAAVAYNKAVDFARQWGYKKDFIENYVIELSPREYAELYSTLVLPERCIKSILHSCQNSSNLH